MEKKVMSLPPSIDIKKPPEGGFFYKTMVELIGIEPTTS